MSKTLSLDVLDTIQIASPCPKRWDEMVGDDRKRFCDDCRLHVYNLSAMTRDEAVGVLSRAEGRVCACFWRRADGTILTQDCPVGLAALRRKTAAALSRLAAAIALVVGGGIVVGAERGSPGRLRQVQPFATICRWLTPQAVLPPTPPMPGGIVLLGKPAWNPPVPPGASPSTSNGPGCN